MKVLVTGSCGLIGSEAALHYAKAGHTVWGVDNNLTKYFFGPKGDTSGVRKSLEQFRNYRHISLDIRDREGVLRCLRDFRPDFVVHTADRPSHDWAAREPFTDFEVNATGTLNLLEAFRQFCPAGVFTLLSTNEVYGDAPNFLPIDELDKRYEYRGPLKEKGIDEKLSIDACMNCLFGASKLAGDVLAQEYGKYFGLNIGAFRGGCLTGSRHASVELHGFLSCIVSCALKGVEYSIFGYKGKQVRDQIHSYDVIQALELFRKAPRPGEVYNLGGDFENSASILEVIEILKEHHGLSLRTRYVEQARRGDHICYYTDLGKFKAHYPEFQIRMSLSPIINEMGEQAGASRSAA